MNYATQALYVEEYQNLPDSLKGDFSGDPGRETKDQAMPRALVVDDDLTVCLLAQEVLQTWGFDVHVAHDGAAAIESFNHDAPDIILCDVMMPGVDGYRVCEHVRAHPQGRSLPVVMMTGLEDVESIERTYALGATDFIEKPINFTVLPRRLRYVLRANNVLLSLQRSEERYALAATGANDGLWDWDLSSQQVYYSPRWKRMLGYKIDEISDSPEEWHQRLHPDDVLRFNSALEDHLNGYNDFLDIEYRIQCKSGNYLWVRCHGLAVRDAQGRCLRMAGSQSDIDRQKQAEAQLLFDAFHDTLTGLPNRALFLDRLQHSIDLAERRSEHSFAVLFLDLDRFKIINDSMGHLIGDEMLKQVAERIKRISRAGDTLARLGGDEFTILVEDLKDPTNVTRFAEEVQRAISQPTRLDGREIVTTASIGIALSTTGYDQPVTMLRDADTAMYRAKAQGGGTSAVFDPAMHHYTSSMLQLELELRDALKRREFRVHYQPITRLDSGEVAGFEALVRWQHPRRGLLCPADFLAVAESSRLVIPIGRLVLQESCQRMKSWQSRWVHARDWHVSVNLSSQELAQPGLVEFIDETLEQSGLDPSSLKLEVTESSLIENKDHALKVMKRLRKRGIQLSIDDFGTGYSSFNYLHMFPFDVLKIDNAFVRDIDKNPKRMEIVKAIITLAHSLGLQVVAEGSETESALQCLQNLPCEFVQGYSISQPIDHLEVDAFVARHQGSGRALAASTATDP